MPVYDYRCTGCGKVREEFRRYEQRDDAAQCECGQPVERAWMPPRVMSDIEPYQSMVTGEMIGSRSQHRDHLKRHSLIELGNEKPKLGRPEITIPRESIRREIRDTVERMKAGGRFREH